MLISVIVPTCNRNDLLARCLEKLHWRIQQLPQEEYEVIISDDGAGDSKEFITKSFPWVKWTQGPRRGPAANRNNGAKQATGEWLAFTDDDCLPANDWLHTYLQAIKLNEHDVLEGKTIPDRDQQRFDEHSPTNFEGGNLWSCNFAIRKTFFLNLRGFDENFPFPAMEDSDLFLRARQAGAVYFVPNAIVVHPWRVMKPFANYRKWLVSHQYFNAKHGVKINFQFRWVRAKILIRDLFVSQGKLMKFRYKGVSYFFEKMLFDFLMIVK